MLTLLLSFFLYLPVPDYFPVRQAVQLTSEDSSISCKLNGNNDFRLGLPCAYRQAQIEFAKKFPAYKTRVQTLGQAQTYLHRGLLYVPQMNRVAYGVTFIQPDGSIAVVVGISGDLTEDFDTARHEFLHYIAVMIVKPNTPEEKEISSWIETYLSPWRPLVLPRQ